MKLIFRQNKIGKSILFKNIILGIIITFSFGQIKPIEYEDSYIYNDHAYQIKVTVKDAANSSGHGQKIYYSIYKNNDFIHPNDWDGGSFTGCRYPFTELSNNYSISRVETNSKTFGWLISTGGICGNTHSYVNILIIPNQDQYYNRYYEYEFLSKYNPTFIDNDEKIDIIYNYQDWGKGGTYSSIFIPERLTINPIQSHYQSNLISHNNIFEKITIINEDRFNKGISKLDFLDIYMAGFYNRDTDLMQYSIDSLYNEKKSDLYNSYFGLYNPFELYNQVSKEKLIYNISQIELLKNVNINIFGN